MSFRTCHRDAQVCCHSHVQTPPLLFTTESLILSNINLHPNHLGHRGPETAPRVHRRQQGSGAAPNAQLSCQHHGDKGGPPHLPSSLSAHSSNPPAYVRAAQPRNPGRDGQEGEQFWATVAPSLSPATAQDPARFPFSPLPSSQFPGQPVALSSRGFRSSFSHLPDEAARRGPLPRRNRCGSPLCNICASCSRSF